MIDIQLANIMGLDTDKAQHNLALKDTLHRVTDKKAFVEYCRRNKDGIEYATKTEKLDTLATRFKKLEEEAKLPHNKADGFCETLTQKVEEVRTFIKDNQEVIIGFRNIKLEEAQYFTDQECKALEETGSIRLIIELAETHKLKEALKKVFMDKFQEKSKYKQLDANQAKINKMINFNKGGLND